MRETTAMSGPVLSRLAPALRSTLREDYGFAALRADLMAGAVVGVVALPLSMALAIASGVPPQHGLYTAIVVILDVEHVPAIDATGIVALESLVARLNEADIKVILVGIQDQPLRALARAGWRNRKGRLRIFRSFDRGVALARQTAAQSPVGRASRPSQASLGAE